MRARFASDGVTADISSDGFGNSLYIASETPVNGLGRASTLKSPVSYVNSSPDAVVFKLTTSDGKVWQQSFGLPEVGRSIAGFISPAKQPLDNGTS